MAWGPFNAGGGGGSSGGTAADISYDNSKSGISAANVQISIHALREEGDLLDRWEEYSLETFLSTPSARRATRSLALAFRSPRNFYPRPPRGGRPG